MVALRGSWTSLRDPSQQGPEKQAHTQWSLQELHLSWSACEPVVWRGEDALPHEKKVVIPMGSTDEDTGPQLCPLSEAFLTWGFWVKGAPRQRLMWDRVWTVEPQSVICKPGSETSVHGRAS
ncbi:uncharacterized protein LOC124906010 isoform X1 [Homo sapiens]|uniref:uncharacterized protein LOC124906010 isoform X1 n=1 Tax=Homo sapiens TaxID=9606 RepID=UPI001FB05788|nr:uncharacterized protein LOC124906010 isoform X1 [Homo sapiens]XP_047302529.1 uncharacterized protein LOC124906010 isoform X1 [Homo sapiens]